jgi:hypothetical protein
MRLRERSFPHPVLGNSDDVAGAAFQAAFEVSQDRQFYYVALEYQCSSRTLESLINEQKASYVTHVECSNTVFRKRFSGTSSKQDLRILADDLNGMVEVNFFICAEEDIEEYAIEGMHSDYQGLKFQIKKGDILAVGDGRVFEAAKDYDALKKVSAIMQIEQSPQDGDLPMRADYDADKIRIFLSKPDFKNYNLLKNYETLQHALSLGIVLPILTEALRLALDPATAEELIDFRWYRNLSSRLKEKEFENEDEPMLLAQRILQLPVTRALKTAITGIEGKEE